MERLDRMEASTSTGNKACGVYLNATAVKAIEKMMFRAWTRSGEEVKFMKNKKRISAQPLLQGRDKVRRIDNLTNIKASENVRLLKTVDRLKESIKQLWSFCNQLQTAVEEMRDMRTSLEEEFVAFCDKSDSVAYNLSRIKDKLYDEGVIRLNITNALTKESERLQELTAGVSKLKRLLKQEKDNIEHQQHINMQAIQETDSDIEVTKKMLNQYQESLKIKKQEVERLQLNENVRLFMTQMENVFETCDKELSQNGVRGDFDKVLKYGGKFMSFAINVLYHIVLPPSLTVQNL